jgi:bile acid-coenzyme A ligase
MKQDLSACIDAAGNPADGAPMGLLLSAQAEFVPERSALLIGQSIVTFAELDRRANRRAHQLRSNGIGQDDRVVIALPNCVEFVECAFAVWKLGATVCPVSNRLTDNEFAAVIEIAEPSAILASESGHPSDVRTLVIDDPPPASLPDVPWPGLAASHGRIMTSGGSTGRPKLIVEPVPAVWGPGKAGYRRPAGSRVLVASPLFHAGPFSTAIYALAQGSTVVCMEQFESIAWLKAIEQHRIDYIYAVPTIMTRIAKLDPAITRDFDLSTIKTLLHMAAPCPPDTKRWWIERIGPATVLELYGGTERLGLTLIDGEEWLRHPGSVGKASLGDEIVILGDDGAPVSQGEIGEVRFRKAAGVLTTYAYIGAEPRLAGDLDSYGDMGWLDSDGYLYIADRRTDMVLIGGANIYPAEIEGVIDSMPGVLGSAVVGLPDADMGNRLHAFVELAQGHAEPDAGQFAAALKSRLSGLKCPRSFDFTYQRCRQSPALGAARGQARERAPVRDPTSGARLKSRPERCRWGHKAPEHR